MGSTLSEISRLNQFIYVNFMDIVKRKKKSGEVDNSQGSFSKVRKWKSYAQSLEKELKEIQNLRIQTRLKNQIKTDLNFYSFSSSRGSNSRRKPGASQNGLSGLRQPKHPRERLDFVHSEIPETEEK